MTYLSQGEPFATCVDDVALDLVPGYSHHRCGPAGHAYNEPAFQHFLAVDRRRAERSIRSLLLVLVHIRRESAGAAPLSDATAAGIFASLGECVREVDFVGWFREGCVAAAVLIQGMQPSNDVRDRTASRIVHTLKKRLTDATNLRVRVVRLCGKVTR